MTFDPTDLPPLRECRNEVCLLPRTHEGHCDPKQPAVIDFVNWKGKQRKRRISPVGDLVFLATDYHPEDQWQIPAICHEDGKLKYFPLNNIKSWSDK